MLERFLCWEKQGPKSENGLKNSGSEKFFRLRARARACLCKNGISGCEWRARARAKIVSVHASRSKSGCNQVSKLRGGHHLLQEILPDIDLWGVVSWIGRSSREYWCNARTFWMLILPVKSLLFTFLLLKSSKSTDRYSLNIDATSFAIIPLASEESARTTATLQPCLARMLC